MRDLLGRWRGVTVAGYDVVRIVLGLLLLSAAALKGHQLATEPVVGSGLLDSRWFLIGVVEFELFFGLWLLSGLYPKWTWAPALSCFALFAGVSLWKALSGEATCGCFGRVPVNPWYTFTLDTAVVVALLRWRPRGLSQFSWSENRTAPLGIRPLGLIAAWLALGIPAAVAMGSYQAATISETGDILGESEIVVLEPEKWIGKRFPLLDYIDVGDRLAEDKWIIVLYHYDCSKCQEVISECERLSGVWAVDSVGTRVALVEMPPYENCDESMVSRGVPLVLGRLRDTREWFGATPIQVAVNEGVVLEAVDWDTRSPRLRLFEGMSAGMGTRLSIRGNGRWFSSRSSAEGR